MGMKKTAALLLAVTLAASVVFYGCEKTGDTEAESEDGGGLQTSAPEDGGGLQMGAPEDENPLQGALGAPGRKLESYDGFIGCGYDVINSPYYQSDHVKQCALDVDQMAADGLIYEDINAQRNTEFVIEAGEDIYSYMNSLAVHAGVKTNSLFGGSLKVDFGLDTSSKVEGQASFAKGSAILTKVKQNVQVGKTTEQTIREKYVLEGFREDWLLNESVSPTELFENYGTHIMFSVSLGGRLDMSYVYNNIKGDSAKKITASVKASWGAVSGETSTEINESTSYFNENSTLTVSSYGGRVDINMSSFDNAKANYQEWATSIEDSRYLTLIKAGNLASQSEMFPIWMLIDTSVSANASPEEKSAAAQRAKRQAAIHDEYKRLLDEAGTNLEKYVAKDVYIKDIYFGAHSGAANTKADLLSKTAEKLYIIELDFNMSAGGNYIYLGYTVTADPDEAIRDIVLHFHRNPPEKIILEKNGASYLLRAEYDLNKGAGGDDIFLFYTKDKAAGDPIKKLDVEIIGVTTNERTGENWSRATDWNEPKKYDLNRNAGGKDIYLWFQK